MEIVRDIFCADEAGNIISNGYGSYEDYIHNVDKMIQVIMLLNQMLELGVVM